MASVVSSVASDISLVLVDQITSVVAFDIDHFTSDIGYLQVSGLPKQFLFAIHPSFQLRNGIRLSAQSRWCRAK